MYTSVAQRFAALGPLRGTLLLRTLWGLWHLPLFLSMPGYNGAGTAVVGIGLPFVAFVVGSVALAVIFSWVFHNSHDSLLMTMLLHASENTVIGAVFLTQVGYLAVYGVYLVLATVIIIATRGQLSYQRSRCQRRLSTGKPSVRLRCT